MIALDIDDTDPSPCCRLGHQQPTSVRADGDSLRVTLGTAVSRQIQRIQQLEGMRVQDSGQSIPCSVNPAAIRMRGERVQCHRQRAVRNDRGGSKLYALIGIDHAHRARAAVGDECTPIVDRKHDAGRTRIVIAEIDVVAVTGIRAGDPGIQWQWTHRRALQRGQVQLFGASGSARQAQTDRRLGCRFRNQRKSAEAKRQAVVDQVHVELFADNGDIGPGTGPGRIQIAYCGSVQGCDPAAFESAVGKAGLGPGAARRRRLIVERSKCPGVRRAGIGRRKALHFAGNGRFARVGDAGHFTLGAIEIAGKFYRPAEFRVLLRHASHPGSRDRSECRIDPFPGTRPDAGHVRYLQVTYAQHTVSTDLGQGIGIAFERPFTAATVHSGNHIAVVDAQLEPGQAA